MGAVTDAVKGFGVTFAHLFRKVVTTDYPFEHPKTAPRYHGRHHRIRDPGGCRSPARTDGPAVVQFSRDHLTAPEVKPR